MTIKTNFDYIIISFSEYQNRSHLIDTGGIGDFEFEDVGDSRDDDAESFTCENYSDDDSSIDSLLDSDIDDSILEGEMSHRRSSRYTRRQRLEELLAYYDGASSSQSTQRTRHLESATEDAGNDDSVVLARDRGVMRLSDVQEGQVEDSLRLTRTRVPIRVNDEGSLSGHDDIENGPSGEDEADVSVDLEDHEFYMPLAPLIPLPPVCSPATSRKSPSRTPSM